MLCFSVCFLLRLWFSLDLLQLWFILIFCSGIYCLSFCIFLAFCWVSLCFCSPSCGIIFRWHPGLCFSPACTALVVQIFVRAGFQVGSASCAWLRVFAAFFCHRYFSEPEKVLKPRVFWLWTVLRILITHWFYHLMIESWREIGWENAFWGCWKD